VSMPQYFVRFPDPTLRAAAQPMLNSDPERFRPFYTESHENVLIADLSDEQRQAAAKNGATAHEDVQVYPLPLPRHPCEFRGRNWAYWETARSSPSALAMLAPAAAAPWQTKTLTDVLAHINAPKAWKRARGKGVTIGIVDTGVSSTMAEFPPAKRSPHS